MADKRAYDRQRQGERRAPFAPDTVLTPPLPKEFERRPYRPDPVPVPPMRRERSPRMQSPWNPRNAPDTPMDPDAPREVQAPERPRLGVGDALTQLAKSWGKWRLGEFEKMGESPETSAPIGTVLGPTKAMSKVIEDLYNRYPNFRPLFNFLEQRPEKVNVFESQQLNDMAGTGAVTIPTLGMRERLNSGETSAGKPMSDKQISIQKFLDALDAEPGRAWKHADYDISLDPRVVENRIGSMPHELSHVLQFLQHPTTSGYTMEGMRNLKEATRLYPGLSDDLTKYGYAHPLQRGPEAQARLLTDRILGERQTDGTNLFSAFPMPLKPGHPGLEWWQLGPTAPPPSP